MKYFRWNDLIVIIGLILLGAAAAFFISGGNAGEGNTAFVYYHNKLLAEIDLSVPAEQTLSFPEAENVIIKADTDGSIYFHSSDCPNKICVKSGKLKQAGQSAACLPNGMLISVKSKSGKAEHDVIIE